MNIKLICLFGGLFFALIGCQKEDTNLYVGAYSGMDQLIPYPFVLETRNDSVSLFDTHGNRVGKILQKEINATDTLRFDTHELFIAKKTEKTIWAYDLRDTIRFPLTKKGEPRYKSVAKLKKIATPNSLDIDKVKQALLDHIWSYEVVQDDNTIPNRDLKIQKSLYFKEDALYVLTDYLYRNIQVISEYETKKYTLFSIRDALFLSFQEEADNPQPIFQIVNIRSGEIELLDFSSSEEKTIRYHKSEFTAERFLAKVTTTNMYDNCFDGYQAEYYFSEDVTHTKGNNYIQNFVSEGLPQNETTSGYVIVHFTINCKGSTGNFGLLQMDKKFKETTFSSEMITHIIHKVAALDDWPSSFSTLDWLPNKDVHAFLMFKITNGKITDVCP